LGFSSFLLAIIWVPIYQWKSIIYIDPPLASIIRLLFFSSPAAALVGEHHMAQARGWVENIDDWKRVVLKGKKEGIRRIV
jgi:hypothetical protein